MLTLTRNRTARLTLIAVAVALVAAIVAPIAAFAQEITLPPPRPRIEEVTLVGKASDRKRFFVGETITANVRFDNRWEVRVVETPDADPDTDPAWQKLRLYIGGIERDATYAGALPGNPNVRQFTYTIQEGDAVKVRNVEAREMRTHNMHYVYVGNHADGCEGGELTTEGALLMSMIGPLTFLIPAEEIYTPYTCDDYASWLIIPNPQNPLRYEGGS